jgi:hypothetical protein
LRTFEQKLRETFHRAPKPTTPVGNPSVADVLTMIYCVIPESQETELAEPMRAHFQSAPDFEVVVERRSEFPPAPEIAERRKVTIPRQRWLSPEMAASGVKFEQRLLTVTARLADEPSEALAVYAARGDGDAATELYWRFYEHIEVRLEELLKTRRPSSRLALAALGRVLDAIAEDERAANSLPSLLERAIRATASDHLSAKREIATEAKSWLRVAA